MSSQNPDVIKKLIQYLKENLNIFYLYIWLLHAYIVFFLLLFIIFIIVCIKDVFFHLVYITLHATPASVWINYCLLSIAEMWQHCV